MKQFFVSERGKRVIIGLSLLALGITAGLALKGLLLDSGMRWNQAIFFVLASGTGLGGLLYMFFARKGLLTGYAIVLFFSLLLVLQGDWTRYFLALATVSWFVLPSVVQYLNKKKQTGKSGAQQPVPTDARELSSRRAKVAQETKDAPMYVLLRANTSIYRVLFRDGVFLFYKIRHEWHKPDADESPDFETLPPMRKGDFSIAAADVTKLSFRDMEEDNNPFDQAINLFVQKRRYSFTTMISSGGAALEQLLRTQVSASALEEAKLQRRYIPSPSRKQKILLQRVYLAICAVALLAGVSWMFLDVPYRLFAWIALVPTPLLLTMYYLFPNEVSIAEKKTIIHGRVSISLGLMMCALIPALRTRVDFNLLEPGRFIIIVGILLVLAIVHAVLSSPESRIRKGQLALIGLIALVYLIGAVGLVNYLLDRTPPQERRAVVQGMSIQRYIKSHTKFLLIVETEDHATYPLGVSRPFYQETTVGEDVLIYFFEGALGISYAEVERIQ